ncbi:MAG: slipin family protein [Bryobacterales bacterium]|nr:slipin family protein [Bryobacterales bacterium]
MLFWKRITVGHNERVLLFRRNRFIRLFTPGDHLIAGLAHTMREERYNVLAPIFASEWVDYLVKSRPDVVAEHFILVETSDIEVAIVFLDGKLYRTIGPGARILFWKGYRAVTVELVNVNDKPEIDRDRIPALTKLGRESLAVFTTIDESKAGLLYLDGKFVQVLGPGPHAHWAARSPRIEIIDLRRQAVEVSGQEILTRDKVTLRVNIIAELRVTDPVKAGTLVRSYAETFYRLLQLAVRHTLGLRTLDEVLADKTDIDPQAAANVRAEMAALGVEVGAISLKDIILPGEIREILNQVVAAERQAQANLIRRREETAATRSLLNTANLMKDHPILIRLKELETLEKLTEKVEHLTVHGGFETLIERFLSK